MRALTLLLVLAASVAWASGPDFTPTPPAGVPQRFWAQLHDAAKRNAEEMVQNKAGELGYRRKEYNEEDWKCMWWFNAWALASTAQRAQPNLCPAAFVTTLEEKYKRTCFGDDGPGGPTGRGWNTVRRAILGRQDVQRVATDPGGALAVLRARPLTPAELAAVVAAALLTAPVWAVP